MYTGGQHHNITSLFLFLYFFFKTESKTLMQMLTDKCMDRQRNIQKGECLNILVLQMKFYKIF